ncbi:hypothetical protein [uncultured Thermomonospora sp.]|uniref:hypothetical protein n=1 Tax=uncultured Thermomonospora sp. TaxID=671175 RepID=UPI00259BF3A5|nr:hypothetical protein [uncultured Thermomonospora sp.]
MASIWEDEDFLNLGPGSQRLYMFLLSQNDLQHCGVIPLRVRRWSKKARGLTVEDIERDLRELATAKPRPFVVIDEDAEELLVRSLMRRDKVYAQPNVFKAAVEQIHMLSSRVLKAAILEELRRLPVEEMKKETHRELAKLIEDLERIVGTPSRTPSAGGSAPPSAATCDPDPGGSEPGDGTPASATAGDTATGGGVLNDPAPPFDVSAGSEAAETPSRTPSRTTSKRVPSEPRGKGNSYGGEVEDSPFPRPLPVPLPAGTAAPRRDAPEATAQTLVGEWLDRCSKRPPQRVIGHVAKLIKEMLGEGIAPDDIRRGMAQWMARGLHPSSLPPVVNEVMNAAPAVARTGSAPAAAARRSTTDERVAAIQALKHQPPTGEFTHPITIIGEVANEP